ncbi:MAG: tyrosine-type recombinase/integrase [Candidatus Sedimenticola sp. (ex Thyasira tokunagai)]
MAKRSFSTPKGLDNLKPSDKAYEIADAGCPGLRVRIEPTGRKTFRWYYQEAGKRRVMTVGTYGDISLAQARRELEKLKDKHKDGVRIAPTAKTPKTVKDLAEKFYEKRIVPHRKRPEIARAVLDNDIIPWLGKLRLTSVTAPAVASMVDKVVERGAATHAGRVLGIAKQMFRFAVSRGYIGISPAETIKSMDLGIESNIRDRFLELDEIRVFWAALDRVPRMSIQIRLALKIMLVTGVRGGELRLARWQEINLDKGLWTIPVKNQKLSPKEERKAKPFVVPLPNMVIDLFRELHDCADGSEWVIPGRYEGPLSDKAMGRAVRRMFELKVKDADGNQEPLIDIPYFSPHDLRRTMRTHLSRLKIPPHIGERCLNHSLGRIVQTYDQDDYLEERREALERWGDAVELAVNPKPNVTQLRA